MAESLAEDTRKEADETPAKAHRRWQLEIKLALKREKIWREKARRVLDVYRGQNGKDGAPKKNSFNILWSNTEILRPALYNSTPKPDVRRRFRQNDMLGKAVGEVMERSLTYCVDAYDLDNCLQNDTLDALLPGRAVSRVRYIPKFKEIPEAQELPAGGASPPTLSTPPDVSTAKQPAAEGTDEQPEATREEVEYEQALCDHVQWDDVLHGPGKVWEEVQWVAFRARLSRDDLVEKFGEEIGKKIDLSDTSDDEVNSAQNDEALKGVFKRAELWEIWDKQGGKVFFLNDSYKKDLLYPKTDDDTAKKGAPPLKLKNFFPIPRPLMLLEDTGSLVPIPLYEMYREQAAEVDRLSARITKIVDACRVRFVHDSSLSELKALMDAGDNEGIPTEQARAWLQNGGIEKAIWWMPIQQVAAVLKELYVARDAAKQVIYEITGISDIIRGASNPNETLGAQKLKANSSSLRLQRMQREVQRYTRDLIRLLAEVIGEHFDPQTLAQMTGLQFPTNAQKQMVQVQMQAAQQMAQQPGAQPPPEVQQKMQQAQHVMSMPSWEDIMGVLKCDMQREYRVDVETDSTVAQSLQQDMEGMKEVLTSVVELFNGLAPAVQSGALSIEAAKAMVMSVVRRARMGLEVEDALESGMQQPKTPPDPAAAKAEQDAKAEQGKQQAEVAKVQAQAQADGAKAQAEAQVQAAKEQEITRRQEIENAHKQAMDAQQKAHDKAVRDAELASAERMKKYEIDENNETKIEVAEISAGAVLDKAEIAAANSAVEGGDGAEAPAKPKRKGHMEVLAGKLKDHFSPMMKSHAQLAESVKRMADESAQPTQFEHGPDGKIAAVHKGGRRIPVVRGADGRPQGLGTVQ